MKTVLAIALAGVVALLSACATQKPAPVVEKSVNVAPVVHSRLHCEPLGGPTSNKCR